MWSFPGLGDCVQAARAAFRASLPGTDAWAWPNNVGPSAKVVGAAQAAVYQRLDYVGRQAFVLYAEGDYLDRHGEQLNVPRKLATAVSGNILITVTGAAAMAAGGTVSRADGTIFTAVSAVSATSSGVMTVPVSGPSGAAANTQALAPLTILSGLTGVGATGATATVDASGLSGGADREPDGAPRTSDLSTYRGRLLFRLRNPPQGGSPSDYVGWGLAVAGVTRVFVERRFAGAGTVRIFPLFDGLFTGGIGDSSHITAVANALALVQPADAAVTVAAPGAVAINATITNLVPNTTAAQSAIRAELADAILRLGRVAGSDTPYAAMPYLATPFAWPALWTSQAVADASGIVSADVAASDVSIPTGSIPVMGTLTFA